MATMVELGLEDREAATKPRRSSALAPLTSFRRSGLGSAADGSSVISGRQPFAAPVQAMMLLEMRVMYEMMALVAASPWLRGLKRGDPHPVLVVPGFIAGDSSTLPLRTLIDTWGYWANGSGSSGNNGPSSAALAQVRQRLVEIHDRYGRKVSIVGSSMGGMFGRLLGREYPDLVRQVITLASPLQLTVHDSTSMSFMTDKLRHGFDPDFGTTPDHELDPLPVPSTSVYTRTDGVAHWEACLDITDDRHENVEVYGTHSGQGFNPYTLNVIADRLAQPEGQWRPFQPPAHLRSAYPRPACWTKVRRHP